MQIRPATPHDAPALAAIYTYHILHGTGTFEEQPVDAAAMADRLAGVTDRGWPWLVAEHEGAVLGYAYASQFRDRPSYRFSAEDSIYVASDAMGQGIGSALLGRLIEASAAAGFRRMYAVIGDSANHGSIRLHHRHGFLPAGQLDAAGWKFGRWIDVVFMQRVIAREG